MMPHRSAQPESLPCGCRARRAPWLLPHLPGAVRWGCHLLDARVLPGRESHRRSRLPECAGTPQPSPSPSDQWTPVGLSVGVGQMPGVPCPSGGIWEAPIAEAAETALADGIRSETPTLR